MTNLANICLLISTIGIHFSIGCFFYFSIKKMVDKR